MNENIYEHVVDRISTSFMEITHYMDELNVLAVCLSVKR